MLKLSRFTRSNRLISKIQSNLLAELKSSNVKMYNPIEIAKEVKLNNQVRKFSKTLYLRKIDDKGDFILFLGGIGIIGFGMFCFLGGIIVCLIVYASYKFIQYIFFNPKSEIKE